MKRIFLLLLAALLAFTCFSACSKSGPKEEDESAPADTEPAPAAQTEPKEPDNPGAGDAETDPAEPSGTEDPAEPAGTEDPAEPSGTEDPAEPSGTEDPAAEEDDPMRGFVPVVRLAVCSDVHITSSYDTPQARRLAKLFESAYRYADNHPTYNTVDALIMAGDIRNLGNADEYAVLNAIIKKNIRPETTVVAAMGNHEHLGADKEAGFLAHMADTLDPHVVIKGFHIIGTSPRIRNDYPPEQIKHLKEELKIAAADDPEKPIFTFQHHHIQNTVYVSRSWYTPDSAALNRAYAAYPQVVNFSGDSHGPMNNPLAAWQDKYSLFNTGTLYYFEMERGMTGGTLPPGKENAAQYYIVEADAENRVRVLPYDILTDDFFKTPSNTDDPDKQLIYVIDKPSDPSTWLYTPDRGESVAPPYFAPDAALTVSDVTDSQASFTHPQAFSDACVYGYRLALKSDKSNQEIKYFSEYYFEPMPETLTQLMSGLADDCDYTAELYPIDCWGHEGEPIRAEFRTEKYEIIPYSSKNPVTYVGTFTDFESVRRLRRSADNGVFGGTPDGDWFAGEWNGAGMIRDTVCELAEGRGYEGSTALAVRSDASSHSNRGIYLYATESNACPTAFGDFAYLRVWVDFTGIDFRKACFGLVTKDFKLYSTDDFDGRSDLKFYYLAEGSNSWKTMTHGGDGCFGAAQDSSVKNFRGWLAFPVEDFAMRETTGIPFSAHEIAGVYLYWDYADDSMLSENFYLDEIALVEDYRIFEPYS